MAKLSDMPNIGKTMVEQLNRAGIETPEQLIETGSRQTWLLIQAFDPSACYNRLCGLEGAVRGIRWHDLPAEVKNDLKEFYQAHKV